MSPPALQTQRMPGTRSRQPCLARLRHSASGFTLLEVVIVMAIVAMLLSVVFTIASGTMTLADDIQRHQRRENRLHAYIDFCERLFSDLPATAALNLVTTEQGGGYLSSLEFQNVSSPFDGTPGQVVTLATEPQTGGGLRLVLSSKKMPDPLNPQVSGPGQAPELRVTLFETLAQCEWRVFDIGSRQWVTLWREQLPVQTAPVPMAPPASVPVVPGGVQPVTPPPAAQTAPRNLHPPLIELKMAVGIDDLRRWVFWIPPADPPEF